MDELSYNPFDPLASVPAPTPVPALSASQSGANSPFAPRAPLPGDALPHQARQPTPSAERRRRDEEDEDAEGGTAAGGGLERNSSVSAGTSQSRTGGMMPRSAQAERPLPQRANANGNNGGGQGGQRPQVESYLRVRVTSIEKNRRDIYIKFSAETNLPTYRQSSYRLISRSYSEFVRFAESIAGNCPQSIVPALPLAQTNAATEEDDDKLVKYAFQKWMVRVTMDRSVMRDEEMRSFIESDFGYTPATKLKRKAAGTGYFQRTSKLPDEKDDELTLAKNEMAALEVAFMDTARAVEHLAKARRNVAYSSTGMLGASSAAAGGGWADVAEQLDNFATMEGYAMLSEGVKRLARTTKAMGELNAALSISEMVTLGDGLAYQAANARAAKETLASRDLSLDEHRTAVKSTISKRKALERLKSGSSIRPERVDEALEEWEDARKLEVVLAQRVTAISQHLEPGLRTHARQMHDDVFQVLIEQARAELGYERQMLAELEAVKPVIDAIRTPEFGVFYHQPVAPAPQAPRRPASVVSQQQPQSPIPQSVTQNMSRSSSLQSSSDYGGNSHPQHQQQQQQQGRYYTTPPPVGPVMPDYSAGAGGRMGRSGAPVYSSSSPNAGQGPLEPSKDRMANVPERRSVGSLARSVVVPETHDRRQRVDARMAASMLANGF